MPFGHTVPPHERERPSGGPLDLAFPTPSGTFDVRVAVAVVQRGGLPIQIEQPYPLVVPRGERRELHEATAEAARQGSLRR